MNARTAVILGRPNVGKSSLFNSLTDSRSALVAEEAGLTRDLRPGLLSGRSDLTLVDTGGLVASGDSLSEAAAARVWQAIAGVQWVLLVTDAVVGPTGYDEELVSRLRKTGRSILLIANKIDLGGAVLADYASLGLGEPIAISALTGRGLATLRGRLEQCLPPADTAAPQEDTAAPQADAAAPQEDTAAPQADATAPQEDTAVPPSDAAAGQTIVLCGRPNAGKSTLLNRLCGQELALVSDIPGTTRDDVEASFSLGEADYTLVDTAGVQRRWRQAGKGHALAAARSLIRLKRGSVVLQLMDIAEGLTEQDLRLLGAALEAGAAPVLAFNKTDLLKPAEVKTAVQRAQRRLRFADFVPLRLISARSGEGVDALLELLAKTCSGTDKSLSTALLNRILHELLQRHPPPVVRGLRAVPRYAHPVAAGPGQRHQRLIRVHGSGLSRLPESYRRYLESGFRRHLGLRSAPVRVEFRTTDNPFAPKSGRQHRTGRTARRSG